jgi:hypothetical protein
VLGKRKFAKQEGTEVFRRERKYEGSGMMGGDEGWMDLAQFWMRLSGKNFILTFQVRIK